MWSHKLQCLSVAWSIAGGCKRVRATLARAAGHLRVSSESTCLSVDFSLTSTLIVPTTLRFCACFLVQTLLVLYAQYAVTPSGHGGQNEGLLQVLLVLDDEPGGGQPVGPEA